MKCARCQAELPEGINFCAGCGHSNIDRTRGRQVEGEKKLQDKIERGRFWNRFSSIFRLGRRF